MPELPEVENIRIKLSEKILNKKIVDITVNYPRIIRNTSIDSFCFILKNQQFKAIERKGKYLIFCLNENKIISHLRMEGKFNFCSGNKEVTKHDHVIFHLDGDVDLRYNDVRKFGTMDLVKEENELLSLQKLGPEPISDQLTLYYLKKQLFKKNVYIKTALLDQHIIAGLGNIYVDEILFKSKILPNRKANELNDLEIVSIINNSNIVIKKAIELGGSSIRTYSNLGEKGHMQELHQVYRKNNHPCSICGTTIKKIKLNGRGTHFCPHCQV